MLFRCCGSISLTLIYSAKDGRMRLSTTRLSTLFRTFLIFGALGFSAPPSVCADESNSFVGDAAESKSDKKEPWKPEDVIYAESTAPQTRISPMPNGWCG